MKLNIIALAALALASLAGCATNRMSQDIRLDRPGDGLALIKLDKFPHAMSDVYLTLQQFKKEPGDAPSNLFENGDVEFLKIRSNGNSDDSRADNYFVKELAPGWYTAIYLHMDSGFSYSGCMADRTIAFEIKPKTVTYLGQYDIGGSSIQLTGFARDQARAEIDSHPNIAGLAMESDIKTAKIMGWDGQREYVVGARDCYTKTSRIHLSDWTGKAR